MSWKCHGPLVALTLLTGCVLPPAAPRMPTPAPAADVGMPREAAVAAPSPPAPSPVLFPEPAVPWPAAPPADTVFGHDLIPFASDRPVDRIGKFDIYLYDRTVETVLALPGANTPADEFTPSLSHGNRWLVYMSNAAGQYDIIVYDMATRLVNTLPNLNTPLDDTLPTINAEGTLIAHLTRVGDRDQLRLYDLRTHIGWMPAPVRQLDTSIHNPFLTADGSRVAFTITIDEGNRDIFVYDLQTAQVGAVPFVNTTVTEDEPVLSSDGRHLVYSTNAGGDFDIKRLDLLTGFIDNLPLLNTPGADASPSYLGLRGDQILFVSNRAGESGVQMYVYSLSTGLVDTVPVSHDWGSIDTFSPL